MFAEIVTANPVLPDTIFWFQSGPYKSLDDANLARSTISVCPRQAPPATSSAMAGKPVSCRRIRKTQRCSRASRLDVSQRLPPIFSTSE